MTSRVIQDARSSRCRRYRESSRSNYPRFAWSTVPPSSPRRKGPERCQINLRLDCVRTGRQKEEDVGFEREQRLNFWRLARCVSIIAARLEVSSIHNSVYSSTIRSCNFPQRYRHSDETDLINLDLSPVHLRTESSPLLLDLQRLLSVHLIGSLIRHEHHISVTTSPNSDPTLSVTFSSRSFRLRLRHRLESRSTARIRKSHRVDTLSNRFRSFRNAFAQRQRFAHVVS